MIWLMSSLCIWMYCILHEHHRLRRTSPSTCPPRSNYIPCDVPCGQSWSSAIHLGINLRNLPWTDIRPDLRVPASVVFMSVCHQYQPMNRELILILSHTYHSYPTHTNSCSSLSLPNPTTANTAFRHTSENPQKFHLQREWNVQNGVSIRQIWSWEEHGRQRIIGWLKNISVFKTFKSVHHPWTTDWNNMTM